MKWVDAWLSSLRHNSSTVLSLSLQENQARWVCGVVEQQQRFKLSRVLASGASPLSQWLNPETGIVQSEALANTLSNALGQLPSGVKPSGVVISVPDKWAYFGELNTPENEQEDTIRYQVEELLESVMGDADRAIAHDWQLKSTLSDGSVAWAVAGIDQRHVDEIEMACSTLKLKLCGITVSNLAALNGYLQMLPQGQTRTGGSLMLYAHLDKHRIHLTVYQDAMLINEALETSDEGFTTVQAVSALERIVTIWSRDHGALSEQKPVLIVGGAMMGTRGIDVIIRRSAFLAPLWLEVSPRRDLATHWHEDVVPFGALEALPCA